MKVYYIGSQYNGCYYVRCLLPQVHNGYNGSSVNLSDRKTNEQILQEAIQADVIVFQRPQENNKVEAIKYLKEIGKKIVFDNDDTYLPNSGVPTTMTKVHKKLGIKLDKINENLYEAIRLSDLVTTTTEYLADEYRKINPNVIVLPNCIDPFNWSEPKRGKGKIRVGLVGSVSNNDEYLHIIDTLDYLKERSDVEIVVFGLPPKDDPKYIETRKLYSKQLKFWDKYADERQPQVAMVDYFDTLNDLKLDLLLIPRKENYFNRCKSNIKFLEASMLEIPVIAQSFTTNDSPYEELDGKIGFKVKTGKSWIPTVKKLLDNRELREKTGKLAKEYTLANYNIENNYLKWAKAYQKICVK